MAEAASPSRGGATTSPRYLALMHRALQTLRENGGEMPRKELGKALGLSSYLDNNVLHHLERTMARKGLLLMLNNGMRKLTKEGWRTSPPPGEIKIATETRYAEPTPIPGGQEGEGEGEVKGIRRPRTAPINPSTYRLAERVLLLLREREPRTRTELTHHLGIRADALNVLDKYIAAGRIDWFLRLGKRGWMQSAHGRERKLRYIVEEVMTNGVEKPAAPSPPTPAPQAAQEFRAPEPLPVRGMSESIEMSLLMVDRLLDSMAAPSFCSDRDLDRSLRLAYVLGTKMATP